MIFLSLEDEMDQSSVYFWNLLEGNEKTVAGTNCKCTSKLCEGSHGHVTAQCT